MQSNENMEVLLREMQLQSKLLANDRRKLAKSKKEQVQQLKILLTSSDGYLHEEVAEWYITKSLSDENHNLVTQNNYRYELTYKSKIHLLDISTCAGLEEYTSLVEYHLNSTEVLIYVFDMNDEKNFHFEVVKMMSKIKNKEANVLPIIYACNIEPYSDNARVMPLKHLKKALAPYGIPLMLYNRRTGEGVEQVITKAIEVNYWPLHKEERKNFIYTMVILARDNNNIKSKSYLNRIPYELKLQIISTMGYDRGYIGKTEYQIRGCVDFIFTNIEIINQLIKKKEKIEIREKKLSHLPQFSLFRASIKNNAQVVQENRNFERNINNQGCNLM